MKGRVKIVVLILLLALIGVCFTSCGNKVPDYYEQVKNPNAVADFTSGFGTDNNGYAKDGAEVDEMIAAVPTERQLLFGDMEYYNFVHFGVNTYTGREWGTGDEDPKKFNPKKLNTDQWCEAFKASGSKGVIITAKHHDGFCLWQTETTMHSMKSSPYKNGKGDVVRELAESCRKYGLKFGVYLSPWDMNADCYGKLPGVDGGGYNEFYLKQLEELLTMTYSDGTRVEIFEMWFDGARGEDAEIDEGFDYDWDAIHDMIYKYQPNCVAAVSGRDVRWVGNEGGNARESEWSVIISGKAKEDFQQNENEADELANHYAADDKGSREAIEEFRKQAEEMELIYYPAESDVKIRNGWFYHWYESPKSVEELVSLYYRNVGWNSSLLLNVGANKDGLIDSKDVKALKGLGDRLREDVSKPVGIKKVTVGNANGMRDDANLNAILEDEPYNADEKLCYDSYMLPDDCHIIDFHFDKPTKVKRMDLREDLRYSQRVEKIEVWAKTENGYKIIGDNEIIGNRKIFMFRDAPVTDTIRLVIRQSRSNPYLRFVGFYE